MSVCLHKHTVWMLQGIPQFWDTEIRWLCRRRHLRRARGLKWSSVHWASRVNLSEPTALTLSFQGRAEAQLQFMTRQFLICILLLSIAITPLLSIKIPAAAQLWDNYLSPAVTDTILRHQKGFLFAHLVGTMWCIVLYCELFFCSGALIEIVK